MRSADGCGRRSRTLATTTPPRFPPSGTTSSQLRPSALMVSPSANGSPPMSGANSRNQESRTFMWGGAFRACRAEPERSELPEEPDVARDELADVVDAVPFLRQAVDAEPEREPRPLLGVEP